MIASYALDDRMGLVSLIAALNDVKSLSLPLDLYFVATTGEEIGFIGALRAAQVLKPEICIALDTSPVTPNTPLVVDDRPVIWYGEAAFNNKADCDALARLADELGFGAQRVVYDAAGSDAGGVKRAGLADRTVAFGFARDNSHGFEIAHPGSLVNVTRLLVAYLQHLAE
jgi:putative aminopeptidase FrvX